MIQYFIKHYKLTVYNKFLTFLVQVNYTLIEESMHGNHPQTS